MRRLAGTVAILRIGITGDRPTAISSPRSLATATIVRRRPSIVTPFDSGEQAGYCGASARIKIDDEQFAALFNELQSRGGRAKLMRIVFLEAHKKKERIALIKAVHI